MANTQNELTGPPVSKCSKLSTVVVVVPITAAMKKMVFHETKKLPAFGKIFSHKRESPRGLLISEAKRLDMSAA